MNRSMLVREVADLANAYLGRGVRIPNVESVAPDERIRNIEELLVRYFVMTGINQGNDQFDPAIEQTDPDVIPFVRKLPGRIKRIKITTEQEVEIGRGEIRGRVDWQETIKTRQYRGSFDDALFVYRRTNHQVQTAENVVLATLIDRIYSIVANQLEYAREHPSKYEWLRTWIEPDSELWHSVEELKFQNKYISQIEVHDGPVPEAVLQDVATARSPLYREAAKLLRQYQNYSNGKYTEADLRKLFNTLFVGPEGTDELFELYWGYKLLTPYDERTLKPITDSSRDIARWSHDGAEYRLRFRSTGSRPPEFFIALEDADDELEILDSAHPDQETYLQRRRAAIDRAADAKRDLLGKSGVERTFWSGEPDLLLTKRDQETNDLLAVFVGEVKYTDSERHSAIADRTAEGLGELAEYMELIRDRSSEYLATTTNTTTIKGAVFVPAFDPDQSVKENIQVITFGEKLDRPL